MATIKLYVGTGADEANLIASFTVPDDMNILLELRDQLDDMEARFRPASGAPDIKPSWLTAPHGDRVLFRRWRKYGEQG